MRKLHTIALGEISLEDVFMAESFFIPHLLQKLACGAHCR